jgi:hypothetical protein
MEEAGLVTRIQRYGDDKRKLSNHYDLSGLVERLKQLEPEFKEVENEAKEKRRKISRPGGLKS